MGVDAVMRFKTVKPLTDDELEKADYGLPSVVGHENFFGRFGKYICMTRNEDGSIEVHLGGRYYGRGYERGPLLVYLAIADWLEMTFPGVEILYGGDNSEEMQIFDRKFRMDLYGYWLANGRQPYERFFGEGPKGCNLCIKPLIECGGGGGVSFLRCGACGSNFNMKKGEEMVRVKDHFSGEPLDSPYTF